MFSADALELPVAVLELTREVLVPNVITKHVLYMDTTNRWLLLSAQHTGNESLYYLSYRSSVHIVKRLFKFNETISTVTTVPKSTSRNYFLLIGTLPGRIYKMEISLDTIESKSPNCALLLNLSTPTPIAGIYTTAIGNDSSCTVLALTFNSPLRIYAFQRVTLTASYKKPLKESDSTASFISLPGQAHASTSLIIQPLSTQASRYYIMMDTGFYTGLLLTSEVHSSNASHLFRLGRVVPHGCYTPATPLGELHTQPCYYHGHVLAAYMSESRVYVTAYCLDTGTSRRLEAYAPDGGDNTLASTFSEADTVLRIVPDSASPEQSLLWVYCCNGQSDVRLLKVYHHAYIEHVSFVTVLYI